MTRTSPNTYLSGFRVSVKTHSADDDGMRANVNNDDNDDGEPSLSLHGGPTWGGTNLRGWSTGVHARELRSGTAAVCIEPRKVLRARQKEEKRGSLRGRRANLRECYEKPTRLLVRQPWFSRRHKTNLFKIRHLYTCAPR